jgi:hypothetical protein
MDSGGPVEVVGTARRETQRRYTRVRACARLKVEETGDGRRIVHLAPWSTPGALQGSGVGAPERIAPSIRL